MICVLVPESAPDYKSQFSRVLASGTLAPFSALAIDFIDALSKAVLLDDAMRHLPEMAAVAHWMRKAHLMELRSAFEKNREGQIWLARGTALHFAPANVDSIFVYSWIISMLMGNGNIVRISERRGDQVGLLLAKVNLLLQEERFRPIADRSLILSYEHDEAVTRRFSESCQIRVLWGGDESVRRLRAVPMNPLASEVVFANRFSLAALNSVEVETAEGKKLDDLVRRFFNDSYWFDQMACSSPRLVVWIGSNASCNAAQERFWAKVEDEVANRGLKYPEIIGLNKLVSAYLSAAIGLSDKIRPNISGTVARVHVPPTANSQFRNIECGGGFFFETEMQELEDLGSLLTEKDQTLSYFGFQHAELKKLAFSLPTRSVDRIVPIGTALNFDTVWDGANLLRSFSREVDLQ